MEKARRGLAPLAGLLMVLFLISLHFGDRIRLFLPYWRSPETNVVGFMGTNGIHFTIVKTEKEGGGGLMAPVVSPLYVNGWNSYWLMDESARGGAKASRMLRRGAEMGMTVCRTWAFSDGGADGLQISPGHFNERVFRALDFVIAEAGRYGVRLVLSLVNNLDPFGGKAQYVKWAQKAGVNVSASADSFFSHPTIRSYYKDYLKTILTRRNYYSGIHYRDDPIIFAWELMNEPRGSNSSYPTLQAWISEMAAYVKSLDQKHLLTVGVEGFYGPSTPENLVNNPGEWGAELGSDFIQNSLTEHIDFASVHVYPDSWLPNATLEEKVKFLSQWVDSHINDGDKTFKKPVLFTEIGSSAPGSEGRDVFLKIMYDKLYESAKNHGAGAGALVWQLMAENMEESSDKFSLVAWHEVSTYNLMIQQSCRLAALNGWSNSSKVRNCSEVLP